MQPRVKGELVRFDVDPFVVVGAVDPDSSGERCNGRHGHLFDEVWYCERDEQARVANLIARHRVYGKSEDEARRWTLGPDQRNAELIARTRPRADLIARLDGQLADGAPTRTGEPTAASGSSGVE